MMREVDLLLYLPPIMKRYYETQKIAEAENPEFQFLWEADQFVRQNIYISTAQEYGLKRYEKILGIRPTANDELEMRRTRVMSRWNDSTPYTYRYLIALLELLTNGNFEVKPNFSEYEIEINISSGKSGVVDEVGYIIKQILPCNLTVISSNKLECAVSGNIRVGAAANYATVIFITNDFKANYEAAGKENVGSIIVQTKTKLLTNDFKACYTATCHKNVGFSAPVVITEYKV